MKYTETVTCMVPTQVTESIEVPDGLVELVNGCDERYGKNGWLYSGGESADEGGTTLARLKKYMLQHEIHHIYRRLPCDCPIKP